MRFEEVWFSRSPLAALGRALLIPLSWLYALGWECYATLYRLGLKRAVEPHRPVVCVGNLVVGGSGKTPTTLALALILRAMGEAVVISVSGYGSPKAEAATLAPAGPLEAREWGDEPAMIRSALPDVPLVVGRRRVLAATLAHQAHPNAVLLLDDGFQHLPLRKHLTLLLDPEAPPNRFCLPAGPYREPRSRRARADLVLGDRFSLARSPLTFVGPTGAPVPVPPHATMLCAIGSPDAFAAALAEAGVIVVEEVRRPDHDPLLAGNLFEGLEPDTPVVVTAKDWVKLRARNDLAGRVIVVALQNAQIEPAAEFRQWLAARLAQVRIP